MCKIFVESTANRAMHSFHDRTFIVGVPKHLKLDATALVPKHVLKIFIRKLLPLINAYWLFGSANMDRNAEATEGPLLFFMLVICRYFVNTSMTGGMYPYLSLYFAYLNTSITLVNVLSTFPAFSSSSSSVCAPSYFVTSSSSSPGINPCLLVSCNIPINVEGFGEGGPRRGVFDSGFRTMNCFGSSGTGEECSSLLEFRVAVSGITRLRQSDIALILVFRLISASRILWGI